jgi:hypothetical protein
LVRSNSITFSQELAHPFERHLPYTAQKEACDTGLGEFDSGHADTSQKAEQILRRAARSAK